MDHIEEEANDGLPETGAKPAKSPDTVEGPDAEGAAKPAPAQIVEDIAANPEAVMESAFPDTDGKEEVSENDPLEETQSVTPAETSDLPAGPSSEPAEVSDDATPQLPPATDVSPAAPTETGSYQMTNGMADKPYLLEIDLKELKIESADLKPDFAEQIEKLGLSATRVDNILRVEGVPSADSEGEYTLFLDYSYDSDARLHRKRFTLLINPDPKSLWKSIEPDEGLPFRKAHEVKQVIVSKDFNIVAASRRGRSHAHEGKFREDDFAIHSDENGWHILIVADGAGSASLSREGSRLACQTAMEFLIKSIAELIEPKFDLLIADINEANTEAANKELKNLLYQTLCGAAFTSYKRLEEESAATGNSLKDYSTTFLLAIVKKCDHGSFIAAFGIGDGAIGVYTENPNTIELMNLPDGGEFSGQTRFLTMRELVADGNEMLRRVKFKLFDKFTMLALMTDGISDPKFGTDNNLVSFDKWHDLAVDLLEKVAVGHVSEKLADQLLEYMDFWSPGEHDDRTLAILYQA